MTKRSSPGTRSETLPEVGGVVHTHSTYACAWAARGEAVPCVLTAMADEFGGEIPVGPFALIGGDDIGRGIVETLTGHRSPAVLMRSHGVFSVGPTAKAAVKAAVMCEDVARTVAFAMADEFGGEIPVGPFAIGGDDSIGLLPALIQTGARAAVVSLWPVDDASTAVFMGKFYEHVKSGLPPARALARAKQELRASPAHAHPFYWAPFVFFGAD